MNRFSSFLRDCMKNIGRDKPLFFLFCVCFFPMVLSVLLWGICNLSAAAAEWICIYISGPLRAFLSFLTSPLPFSLAEILIPSVLLCFLVYLTAHLVCLIRRGGRAPGGIGRFLAKLLCVLSLLLSFFITGFLVCYHRIALEEKIGLNREGATGEELIWGMTVLQNKLNSIADHVTFVPGGASVMPYSYRELNRRLNQSYRSLYGKYPFLTDFDSNVKPLAVSPLMTYTHISGIYTPFTGEANLNINYPDYVVAFTAAHEMAHQRGIAPEDEANFLAYLVCVNSKDPYLNYCGLLNMLDYFGSALYQADSDRYFEIIYQSDSRIIGELQAFSAFFRKYSDSASARTVNIVNDKYLKSQGQAAGVQSYGLVVDLAVAWLKNERAGDLNPK